MSTTTFDLRGHVRYPRQVEVRLSVDGHEHRARSRDMSLGGLFAETSLDLPAGAELQLAFRVQSLRDEVRVPATVRWVQRDPTSGVVGFGVRFDGLGRVQQWGLNKFLAG